MIRKMNQRLWSSEEYRQVDVPQVYHHSIMLGSIVNANRFSDTFDLGKKIQITSLKHDRSSDKSYSFFFSNYPPQLYHLVQSSLTKIFFIYMCTSGGLSSNFVAREWTSLILLKIFYDFFIIQLYVIRLNISFASQPIQIMKKNS